MRNPSPPLRHPFLSSRVAPSVPISLRIGGARGRLFFTPPFSYTGSPTIPPGMNEREEEDNPAAASVSAFAPKVIGVTKYGNSPCELGIDSVNVLINLTKKVNGMEISYIRFVSKKFRRVRVKYLPHNAAYSIHPVDVGMDEKEWRKFVRGLKGEERTRAEEGWKPVVFLFAVFPNSGVEYSNTISLVGLRDYPPFNERQKLIKAWADQPSDAKTDTEIRVFFTKWRGNSKKVDFQDSGIGMIEEIHESRIHRYLSRHTIDRVFRRVNMEWFYEGIQKMSDVDSTPVVEKVKFEKGEKKRRRPRVLLEQ